ncbi:hypothetical protein [Paraburkholderia sp. BCC1884]|uniref:hypothetical protein n=1 Tax=Paraburkholderia sp. BCC1884 TaxID=2562668 RepID=UPI0011826CB8|nr:hypothetical protein [Paraburkholderia sp. BCC1884]
MRSKLSQLAAHDALDEDTKRTQKQVIMDLFALPETALTRQDIADRTNMRLGSVCGRVNSLLKAERLIVRGSRKCVATGQSNDIVGLPVEVAA